MNESLYNIAKYYHKTCDYYDSCVCTGEWGGEPYPVNLHEHTLVNKHAERLKRELVLTSNYTHREIIEAISSYRVF